MYLRYADVMCRVCIELQRVKGLLKTQLSVLLFYCLFSDVLAQTHVPYCIDPSWLPYEAIQDGKHIGLSADYIQYLNDNTTYQFQLVETKSWQQSINFIKQGKCLVLPMLNHSAERATFMDFSKIYFSSPNFLISDIEQPFMQSFENIGNRTLGVTAGYRITEYIAKNHPQINTVVFENELAGLIAVASGEVDLFVGSVHSVNNHIQNLGLAELKIAGWGGPDDYLRMGVSKGHEAILQNIDQALSAMTRDQHFEIYNRWNDVKIIDNTNYKLIWQLTIGALFLFTLILVRYFSVKRYNHHLTTKNHQLNDLQHQLLRTNADLQKISQQDGLTHLYNRHYFNHLISNQDFKQKGQPLCLIFIDLDWFKEINDEYGHVVGDQVLREFAKLLKLCCPNDEIVCRWGGEEFVIMKQPSELTDAKTLCIGIQNHMKNHSFNHGAELTCSFGVAQLQTEESILSCLERADQLLYQAKAKGRNRIGISA